MLVSPTWDPTIMGMPFSAAASARFQRPQNAAHLRHTQVDNPATSIRKLMNLSDAQQTFVQHDLRIAFQSDSLKACQVAGLQRFFHGEEFVSEGVDVPNAMIRIRPQVVGVQPDPERGVRPTLEKSHLPGVPPGISRHLDFEIRIPFAQYLRNCHQYAGKGASPSTAEYPKVPDSCGKPSTASTEEPSTLPIRSSTASSNAQQAAGFLSIRSARAVTQSLSDSMSVTDDLRLSELSATNNLPPSVVSPLTYDRGQPSPYPVCPQRERSATTMFSALARVAEA